MITGEKVNRYTMEETTVKGIKISVTGFKVHDGTKTVITKSKVHATYRVKADGALRYPPEQSAISTKKLMSIWKCGVPDCFPRNYRCCRGNEGGQGKPAFFLCMAQRARFTGVRLIIGDKCPGMLETVPEVFPTAKYQRYTVHFYRNIFSATPHKCMKEVSMMLKAIHAQENKAAAREKAAQAAEKLRQMKLSSAAKKREEGIDETLTYMEFPSQHWSRIRTNNTMERLNREIKRRTKAIGAFPDGQSALMLVCARLRHVAGTQWGAKRCMNMEHLHEMDVQEESDYIAG